MLLIRCGEAECEEWKSRAFFAITYAKRLILPGLCIALIAASCPTGSELEDIVESQTENKIVNGFHVAHY